MEGVAGVNLPMLIKALTHRDAGTVTDLAEKALQGGGEGIARMEHRR